MTSVRLNESYRLSLEAELTALARAFVSEELGVTECVRQLVPILRELELDHEESLIMLVGAESDLDGFPLGPVRDHWSESALARQDKERCKVEELYRADVLQCCRYAIEKFAQ